ncbi:DUF7108 domain-containing protein [Halomicrobium katesii]|uniref:DUF7108 domain-containing protein n=1 Tax=Halomicrobium katesii TaxID=437163 RepID=UPI00036F1BD6|nr:hypothetical protein [Halomicrobium katesii]
MPEHDDSTTDSALPTDVVDEAERLTRLARDAVDDAEARAYRDERDELLAEHEYTARVREDDARDVLVCHPGEWISDGRIHPDRIDDVDRGIERPLSGPGEGSDWAVVAEHNDELVAAVADDDGEVHAANARALADFASNHYAKPIEDLTRAELVEFRDDYFERNVWPDDRQASLLNESLRRTFEKMDVPYPLGSDHPE